MTTAEKVAALEAKHPSIRVARRNLVSTVPGLTPEQIALVTNKMLEEQAEGRNWCLWHTLAIVFDYLDRCPCLPCETARKVAQ